MFSSQDLSRAALIAASLLACAQAQAASLTGSPMTAVKAGSLYATRPGLTGAGSAKASYQIANKPSWASFSRSTGKLTGRPSAAHLGTYANVLISAKVGKQTLKWPAFSITVKGSAVTAPPAEVAPQPKANLAPSIAGVPATAATVGTLWSFAPSATDAEGNALTFSIQNKPSWASFNATTGALSGTPDAPASLANVTISVSDGQSTASLRPFSLTVAPAPLATVSLHWQAPTQNVDGTALTNLAGFKVRYGTNPAALTQTLELPNPQMTSVMIEELKAGTYHFAVIAYTADGLESDLSEISWKTL